MDTNTTTKVNNTGTSISFEMPQPNLPVALTSEDRNPWERRKASHYQDLTLQPECLARRMRFHEGDNWLRVVPAISGSKFEWVLVMQTLEFPGGRFTHPKTLRPGAKCAFDEAYEWSKRNCPGGLYSKANKDGVRLLSDPQAVLNVISEDDGQPIARLLVAGGYNGSRGGTPALGWRIWNAIIEHDTSKSAVPDAVHPEIGVRICITKKTVKGNLRPMYSVSIGRQPSPILPIINAMSPEERSRLVPLENTIRTLTEDEEWECLAKVMAPSTVQQIRASLDLA